MPSSHYRRTRRRLRSAVTLAVTAALGAACAKAPALVERPAPRPESCRAAPISNGPVPRIRWYGPDKARDYRELWWRCIGVGPAVVWTPLPQTQKPLDSLVVVSWNVHVGGAHLAQLVEDLRAGRLLEGGPVREFVLLLQEAYRDGLDSPPAGFKGARPLIEQPANGPRVDILETARTLNLHLYYVPSMRNGNSAEFREDRGNAILATLPLSDLRGFEVAFEIQRRVAMAAVIEGRTTGGNPWHITLAVVHLDATQVRPAMWRDLSVGRTRQAKGLAPVLGRDSNIVVGGDFNTMFKGEGALRIFGSAIGRIPGSDSRPTRPPFQPDHIFARLPGSWRIAPYRRLDSMYHSDHFPLITRIVFGPAVSR